MCGLVATWSLDGAPVDRAALARGIAALTHRGPDGAGRWIGQGVALGHTRLAIVDPSGGAQPFHAEEAGVVAVVTGELYGHAEQRRTLEARGHRFRSRCDAEVLVHLYAEHGLGALDRLDGEFAFALYDKPRRRLVVARDRLGVRSLVWHFDGATLRVASEAKALFAQGVAAAWDPEAVWQAFSHQYLHPNRTVFNSIHRLPAGGLLVADMNGVRTSTWWALPLSAPTPVGDEEGVARLDAALRASVEARLTGERPIGFQLSGGLDSSTIVGLAADLGVRPVCFTARFPGDAAYDEGALARETAARLGATLHEVWLDGPALAGALAGAVAQVEGLCINAHVAAKMALAARARAEGVRVLLSGEGADELFMGYTHLRADLGLGTQALDPANQAAIGIHLPEGPGLSTAAVQRRLGFVPSFLQAKATLGRRARAVLTDDFLRDFVRRDPFDELLDAVPPPTPREGHPADLSAWLWTRLCLSGYILPTLCEPTELAHGVEGRPPFLDQRVVEVARALPHTLKVRDGVEKWALRQLARDHVTPAVHRRAKHPFMAPPFVDVAAQFRDATLPSFIDSARLDTLVRSLPTLPERARVATDPVVVMALSCAALQRAWMTGTVGAR